MPDALTDAQRAALARPGPWAWFVVMPDGFTAKPGDEASARDFAAKSHGVLVPLAPMEKPDEAA